MTKHNRSCLMILALLAASYATIASIAWLLYQGFHN